MTAELLGDPPGSFSLAGLYVALALVAIYFNAAVIGTTKKLEGHDASIRDALALARQRIGKVFV